MTKFLDGPAAGQTLMLHRAPIFLRVVEQAGEFDALDQLEDEPRPGEKLYAYRRTGDAGYAFIDFGGKSKKASGCYPIASYSFIEPQPTQAEMSMYPTWAEWCGQQIA